MKDLKAIDYIVEASNKNDDNPFISGIKMASLAIMLCIAIIKIIYLIHGENDKIAELIDEQVKQVCDSYLKRD